MCVTSIPVLITLLARASAIIFFLIKMYNEQINITDHGIDRLEYILF